MQIFAKQKMSNLRLLWKIDLAHGSWHIGWVSPCPTLNLWLANVVSSTTRVCILFPWVRSTRVEARCDKYQIIILQDAASICFSILIVVLFFSSLRTALLTLCPTSAVINSQGERTQTFGLIPSKRTGIRRAVPKHAQLGKSLVNDVANCPEYSRRIIPWFNVR